MLAILQFTATFSTIVFAGAAIYVSLVEHPARMSCSTALAATVWAPSYKRATLMQAPLAIIGAASGTLAWWLGGGLAWLAAAVLIFLVVPFSLTVIMAINKQLLAPGRQVESAETRALLIQWGHLHAVRTVLGTAASVLMLLQLVRS